MSNEALEQRLWAILAADVAGYSRLMAIDDRATVAALDAARAVFRSQTEAHHGRRGKGTQQLSIWDARVIEAAHRAEAQTLYSEDFSHGQRFGKLTVLDPFAA